MFYMLIIAVNLCYLGFDCVSSAYFQVIRFPRMDTEAIYCRLLYQDHYGPSKIDTAFYAIAED